MPKKIWNIRDIESYLDVVYLADSIKFPEPIAKILILRGISTYNQAKSFFRPSLNALHNPYLMFQMDIAVNRVIKAISEHERILIYGDYDVDGTCSTALMLMFLRELGADVEFYIPNRITEGYGVSELGIEAAKQTDTKLMITVDCGITAVSELSLAKKLDIDVIICDHHQPKDVLPDVLAILDPLHPECKYPFKYLSGAGVAFKLAQGVSEKIGNRELPYKYLDLVALAGAADIVPITDENRILVKYGLDLINSNPRPGIKALLEKSYIKPGKLSSGQIVFTLAPRINAVGRLGNANSAVQLLMTESEKEAYTLAEILESDNRERRKIDEDTLSSAISIIEEKIDLDDSLCIVLHEEGWHPGVIGIVASRIVEKFYRPTIMLTTIDGVAKGSARSISDFNIYEALKECEDLLLHFGGHKAAAGLAVELDKLEEFRFKLNSIVREKMNFTAPIQKVDIDVKIKLSEITTRFVSLIDLFAPFGPANPRPVFLTEEVEIIERSIRINPRSIAFTVKQNGCNNVFDCIVFDVNFQDIITTKNRRFDMVYFIDFSEKSGKIITILKVKDIKFSEIL